MAHEHDSKANGDAILEVRNISKSFGGVKAVDDVDVTLHRNEIMAVVGDNGAGKSTLIKMISGVYSRDSGTIHVNGELAHIETPMDAKNYGIETVYQTESLIKILDAPANIFLGREKVRDDILGRLFRVLDFDFMKRETEQLLERFGVTLMDIKGDTRDLSGGQAQTVAIGRAVYWGGKILILDEPTNNLGVVQERRALDLVRRLRDEFDMTIILISHNLKHVIELVDRIVVLRNGKKMRELVKEDTDMNEIVSLITGVTE